MSPPTEILIGTREKLKESLESGLEYVLRLIFFWEKDEKQLGTFIKYTHTAFVIINAFIYITLTVWMDSYVGLICFVIMYGLIWAHHMICGGCIMTYIERRLTGESRAVTDPVLDMFYIPNTPETSAGIFLLLSSVFMAVLVMQLSSKTVQMFRQFFV
jgi:hypothetical protein